MGSLYDELEYPKRAEFLDAFAEYRVELEHWRGLSERFSRVFRQVYSSRAASVLLVHAPQGAGKSLFCARLEQDYKATVAGATAPDMDGNLWHLLVAQDRPDADGIDEATRDATVTRIDPATPDWFSRTEAAAVADTRTRVRIFLLDDAHQVDAMYGWLGMSHQDFAAMQRTDEAYARRAVAQKINAGCRGAFKRSIFVMFSNDREWVDQIHAELERWFSGLAAVVELPMPEAPVLERIIRTNTNRLNRVSYWYCLDAAKLVRRQEVRATLLARRGFTESFEKVSETLSIEGRRQGRPGNRNVLTLVTLASRNEDAESFLAERGIEVSPLHIAGARHVGVWHAWDQWASKVVRRPDAAFLRRARMLESEFMLRWVSLDLATLHALLQAPAPGDLGARALDLVCHRPSIGDPTSRKELDAQQVAALDAALEAAATPADVLSALDVQLKGRGAQRSLLYEAALRARLQGYGRGMAVHSRLRPDFVVAEGEYQVCAVTRSASDDKAALTEAIKRTGHTVEFTAHMVDGLAGLEGYLRDKIVAYAEMIESV